MKFGQFGCSIGAIAVAAITVAATHQLAGKRPRPALPGALIDAAFASVPEDAASPSPFEAALAARLSAPSAAVTASIPPPRQQRVQVVSLTPREEANVQAASLPPHQEANVQAASLPASEQAHVQLASLSPPQADPAEPAKRDFSYLDYYVYAEIPPEKRPALVVMDALKETPVGTALEEIKRAADAFGLDYGFMKAVAKIESDFDPKQRTGSYIGLYQLSRHEFSRYGGGEITNPRDNSIAAAYKFVTEAAYFEWETHKKPTFSDLYLIHQQGWQGAAEHVSHPDRIAWRSMCATDEGHQKGERWCKRAIWKNTLPAVKHAWKSVDRLTSAAFVAMWRERMERLYARYADVSADQTRQ